jgi:hypothetical protein
LSSDRFYDKESGLSNGTHGPTEIKNSDPSFIFPFYAALNDGSRALEAFVRPSVVVVAGQPITYGFDMRSCTFSLEMIPFEEHDADDGPTEIFLPEYFFRNKEPEISVSSGNWTLRRSCQVLQWWHHGLEKQRMEISSDYRRERVVGTTKSAGQPYWGQQCRIM